MQQHATLPLYWLNFGSEAIRFSTPPELGGTMQFHAWVLPMGQGRSRCWRAFICIPTPRMLRGTFPSTNAAIAAVDGAMAAGQWNAPCGPSLHSPADGVWDTPWITDARGDASRRAAGAAITVRHEWEGYVCKIEGESFGPTFMTAQCASDWFDRRVPPPHPQPSLQLISRRLRQAAQSAAQRAGGDMGRFCDLFAQGAWGALHRLGQLGMTEDAEYALIASLVTGKTPVLRESGYAGVVV